MDVAAPQLSWIMLIISSLLAASCAGVAFWLGSRSTPERKRERSPPPTPPSASHLARMEADQAELFSTLEKLTTTVKRLSSRAGMRDVRERQATVTGREVPPEGTNKNDLYRHYGLSGKAGRDFYQRQLEIEAQKPIVVSETGVSDNPKQH